MNTSFRTGSSLLPSFTRVLLTSIRANTIDADGFTGAGDNYAIVARYIVSNYISPCLSGGNGLASAEDRGFTAPCAKNGSP